MGLLGHRRLSLGELNKLLELLRVASVEALAGLSDRLLSGLVLLVASWHRGFPQWADCLQFRLRLVFARLLGQFV